MGARMLGEWVDSLVLFAAGAWFAMPGFRIVGKGPGEDMAYGARYERHLKWFGWLGPVLMVIAVALAVGRLVVGRATP